MTAARWKDDHWLYTAVRVVGEPFARFYFRLRGTGMAHIPSEGPFIITANHQSLADAHVLGYFVPRQIHYLITRKWYESPTWHWLFSRVGHIPARAGRLEPSSLKEILRRLDAGEVVGLFPEGRMSEDGELQPGRGGVIRLALRANVPIVPAGIAGTFEIKPRHGLFPKPGRVAVAYGEPISPEKLDLWVEETGSDQGAAARLMEEIRHLRDTARLLRGDRA